MSVPDRGVTVCASPDLIGGHLFTPFCTQPFAIISLLSDNKLLVKANNYRL